VGPAARSLLPSAFPRLGVEVVSSTCWLSEVRSLMKRSAWTPDLTVLGRVYDVSLETLGLRSYVPIPGERDEVHHRRAVRKEDVNERDATEAR
jgi:hypothetical protein